MGSVSTTVRSRKYLEGNGYHVGVTEFWNAFAGKRHDLFNIADLVAFDDDVVILVQCTTRGCIPHRRKKILDNPISADWLIRPDRKIWIIGWERRKKKVNGRLWVPVIREVTHAEATYAQETASAEVGPSTKPVLRLADDGDDRDDADNRNDPPAGGM